METVASFSVGDRVRVIKTSGFFDRHMGKTGTVSAVRRNGWVDVQFEGGGEDNGLISDIELIQPAAVKTVRPKVGDRVVTRKVAGRGRWEHGGEMQDGALGVVERIGSDGDFRVRLDGRDRTYVYSPAEVHPVAITLAPGSRFTGVVNSDGTFSLTPVEGEAPSAEVRPALSQGQVWRDGDGCIVVKTDEPRICKLRSGYISSRHSDYDNGSAAPGRWTFVAESLADALETGKITPADLR